MKAANSNPTERGRQESTHPHVQAPTIDGKKVLYTYHLHHGGKVEGVGDNIKYTGGQGSDELGGGQGTDSEEKEKRTCEWKNLLKSFLKKKDQWRRIIHKLMKFQLQQRIHQWKKITQADDIPPFTQDSQQSKPAHREDETRSIQLFEGGNVVKNVKQSIVSHFLATNATTSLRPPTQASQGGVAHMSRGMDFPRANIRAPAPVSFHPK
ncbi:hypothetical protein OROMI_002665 [Orobanche minor]